MIDNLDNQLRQRRLINQYKKMLFAEKLKEIKAGKPIVFDDYTDEEIIWIFQEFFGEDMIVGFVDPNKFK